MVIGNTSLRFNKLSLFVPHSQAIFIKFEDIHVGNNFQLFLHFPKDAIWHTFVFKVSTFYFISGQKLDDVTP